MMIIFKEYNICGSTNKKAKTHPILQKHPITIKK